MGSHGLQSFRLYFSSIVFKEKTFKLQTCFFNRQKMAKALRKLNIPVTVILDAAVG